MKRPSFQFYPADWRNNANLRRCSWAARGAWIDVMGLMHDSDHYGLLRWSLKEIARAIGCPLALVRELADRDVMKGADSGECESYIYTPRSGRKDGEPVTLVPQQIGPVWYSSRLVRDEYVRTIRGDGGRFGETPKPPKGDGSTSTSTSTTNSEANASGGKPPAEMSKDELWKAGKSLLAQDGLPEAQCGSFVGGLVKQYGETVVIDAVRSTVVRGAADAREYLKATCMRMSGERKDPAKPVTVVSDAADRTAQMLAEQARHHAQSVAGPVAVAAKVADIKARLAGKEAA